VKTQVIPFRAFIRSLTWQQIHSNLTYQILPAYSTSDDETPIPPGQPLPDTIMLNLRTKQAGAFPGIFSTGQIAPQGMAIGYLLPAPGLHLCLYIFVPTQNSAYQFWFDCLEVAEQ
jgi:hypothetical protein